MRRDSEQVLRAMQRTVDRQKTLAMHGVLLSDDRLPMTTMDVRDLTSIDGRVLVHGEEEASGRSCLMLEGTDGQFTTCTARQRWRSCEVSEGCESIRSFDSASSPRFEVRL